MNKRDAAAYLGISPRALEYHVTQGNIGRRMVKGQTGAVADFDEGELRQLKAKLDAKRAPRPAVSRDESPEGEPRSPARLADVRQLADLLMASMRAGGVGYRIRRFKSADEVDHSRNRKDAIPVSSNLRENPLRVLPRF